jgi:hypothetical protein
MVTIQAPTSSDPYNSLRVPSPLSSSLTPKEGRLSGTSTPCSESEIDAKSYPIEVHNEYLKNRFREIAAGDWGSAQHDINCLRLFETIIVTDADDSSSIIWKTPPAKFYEEVQNLYEEESKNIRVEDQGSEATKLLIARIEREKLTTKVALTYVTNNTRGPLPSSPSLIKPKKSSICSIQ